MQCQGVAGCEGTMTKVTSVTCGICQGRKFSDASFYNSLVQVFQRSDRKTASGAIQCNDGPILAGHEGNVARVEAGE